jgi:hypothetical protein
MGSTAGYINDKDTVKNAAYRTRSALLSRLIKVLQDKFTNVTLICESFFLLCSGTGRQFGGHIDTRIRLKYPMCFRHPNQNNWVLGLLQIMHSRSMRLSWRTQLIESNYRIVLSIFTVRHKSVWFAFKYLRARGIFSNRYASATRTNG